MRSAPLIAHAGGLDELAFTLVPVVVFSLLAWRATRRAAARAREEDRDSGPP